MGVKFLAANTILGERYQIASVLGKGGSGAVYKAIDLHTNQTVAVKVLTVNEFDPHAAMQRQYFQREVGLLKKVSHPNIIHILDSGISDEGQPYLITDYIDGRSLKSIMRTNLLSLEKIAYIFEQVASALQAIHDQRIIHRDFKPQNILISQNQEPEIIRLLDFGIAKMLRGGSEEAYLHTITSKGIIPGTLQYMSPEQCQGNTLDERTDIYSMGITAYEMVSGRLPFDKASSVGIILMHVEAHVPEIENIAKPVEAVIMRALEKLPENRFARATDFSKAFTSAVAEVKQSGKVVIAGDGASAEAETQSFSTEFTEAPTAQHENPKKFLWGSIKE
jgi:eukaryotic-like serine/threonine-protein kinase